MSLRSGLIFALVALAGCAHLASTQASAARSHAIYQQPVQPSSILIVTDRVANARFAPTHARQVANALRHFTPHTSWVYIDQLTPAQVASAGAVVYLGDNGLTPVPARSMEALRKAKVFVLTRFHECRRRPRHERHRPT
ncbi:MAG: hypothetical protein ABR584_04225 [Candidatus Baltobacteraceae bacterium]